MKSYLKREDDYNIRREHLKNLTDEELKAKFWELAEKIVDPLLDIAKTHTTPSIERSVLLRMGFSSLEAKPLVDEVITRGYISYGAGHVVYALSKEENISVRVAGEKLLAGQGWDIVEKYFNEVKNG